MVFKFSSPSGGAETEQKTDAKEHEPALCNLLNELFASNPHRLRRQTEKEQKINTTDKHRKKSYFEGNECGEKSWK